MLLIQDIQIICIIVFVSDLFMIINYRDIP